MGTILDRIKEKHNNLNLSMETPIEMAELELTAKCNLQCKFCYNKKLRKQNKRQRFVSDDDFELFLHHIQQFPTIKQVGLYGLGESSLHPNVAKYYKKIKEEGYFTYLTSNGVFIDYLINAIPYIDSLKFSFNYKNREDFAYKTKSDPFTYMQIIRNINLVYDINQNISISVVLDNGDTEDMYTDSLSMINCKNIFFVSVLSQGGTYNSSKGGAPSIKTENYKSLPCWSLFKGLYVDCDLNIRTCAYGNTSDLFILGNLKESKNTMMDMKDMYKSMNLKNFCPPMCEKCIGLNKQ